MRLHALWDDVSAGHTNSVYPRCPVGECNLRRVYSAVPQNPYHIGREQGVRGPSWDDVGADPRKSADPKS